jgi:predicted dehydrogenase
VIILRNRRLIRAAQHARFRVAFIGCGRIADVHAEALRAVHDATLVACCDLDRTAAASEGLTRVLATLNETPSPQ